MFNVVEQNIEDIEQDLGTVVVQVNLVLAESCPEKAALAPVVGKFAQNRGLARSHNH